MRGFHDARAQGSVARSMARRGRSFKKEAEIADLCLRRWPKLGRGGVLACCMQIMMYQNISRIL
jgi:hypothetical protein